MKIRVNSSLREGICWAGGCPPRRYRTDTKCVLVCAVAFGKEEAGGGFEFQQPIVDNVLVHLLSSFSGNAS